MQQLIIKGSLDSKLIPSSTIQGLSGVKNILFVGIVVIWHGRAAVLRVMVRSSGMFESMSITSQARVFQCPVCKETIDTSAQKCRFYSATIDPRAAEEAAEAMAKVNQLSGCPC